MKAADRTAILMTMAYIVALGSKDRRTKIGAVIVGPDNEIRSTGHNGYPRGLDDDVAERQQKPEKDYWFEHAERNAIFNAARIGVALKGCTLYTQRAPCEACARAVVQAGIAKVVVHAPWCREESDRHPRSRQIFAECGVRFDEWDGDVLEPVGWCREQAVK